ncbi:bifunctional aminotransferase class I/II-fold pyridoxal phosphate-dependent enzyme/GNAT family N-acetyltransferase [Paractinoplanes atraurantiacus]|uniref:dTDP-4-amino-4,6-dideoxygalactose transaminase n=1 Tax=Paractinoplanes atraurantiacus TaxID=1036182 RepID=A0A285I7N5_9ACTN|nr:bifunctional aminotransferase class I/II-fold pyridoxal phosphate-dependent enzyme/GNAT family N-acetyltransferase [Actinoplanes atraurantiacus]SNY43990.1 dTDP-4-amino-4,6-dideoxygalactose transaminase [Actinoplanes atraurantiacus]
MTELLYYRGRVALHAILRGLGVSAGDEVIVQAYTCAAVIEPLQRLQAVPVYVDIDRATYTMDLGRLAAAITGRTRAIVVQHTFGTPVDLDRVLAIAGDVPVVEDCAHITEPAERGPVGTSGVAAFYSYEWGKPVIAGVGGKAVVNDERLAATMREQYAAYTSPPARREAVMTAQFLAHQVASELGVTWRLRALYRRLSKLGLVVGSYAADVAASPEYQWRMTRSVRRRLPRRTAKARNGITRRTTVAARYRAGVTRLGFGVPTPLMPPLRVPVAVADKQGLLQAAAGLRLEVGDWFATPVHPLTGEALEAAGYRPGSCPNAEWAAKHVVSFPVRADVDPHDVERGIDLLGLPDSGDGLRILSGPFSDAQIRAVAEMHATEVAHGFLSSLGVPALEVLYRHVAASRHCALLLAVDGGRPVGYICGSLDTSALVREFIRRRWWVAAPALLPRLLSPGRVFRAIETLRYAQSDNDFPKAEVINFVVLPPARGAGLATQLFDRLMDWFSERGETAVKMVTGEQQRRAHGFYRKVGAELRGHTSIHSGTASRVYLYRTALREQKPQTTP